MRKHESVGEMISTCCFVGVSFYLLIYSLVFVGFNLLILCWLAGANDEVIDDRKFTW